MLVLFYQVEKVADVMGMCSQVLRRTKKRSDGRALDFMELVLEGCFSLKEGHALQIVALRPLKKSILVDKNMPSRCALMAQAK